MVWTVLLFGNGILTVSVSGIIQILHEEYLPYNEIQWSWKLMFISLTFKTIRAKQAIRKHFAYHSKFLQHKPFPWSPWVGWPPFQPSCFGPFAPDPQYQRMDGRGERQWGSSQRWTISKPEWLPDWPLSWQCIKEVLSCQSEVPGTIETSRC